jgi:hypothetical protein
VHSYTTIPAVTARPTAVALGTTSSLISFHYSFDRLETPSLPPSRTITQDSTDKMQTAFFPQYTPQQNVPSGSSFQSKRKRQSWTQEDFAYESSKVSKLSAGAVAPRVYGGAVCAWRIGAGKESRASVSGEEGAAEKRE